MKVSTTLKLSEGMPKEWLANNLDDQDRAGILQASMPHIARLEYTPNDVSEAMTNTHRTPTDESPVTIRVGTHSYMTKDGISEMSGTISAKAAMNLFLVLKAWKDGAYE